MEVKIYKNTAEKMCVDKTEYLTLITTIDGTLVPSPLNAPVFDWAVDTESEMIPEYNYCYIVPYNKYYFVSKIEWISNNIYRIYLEEDYLMSFSAGILGLTAYVTRNENATGYNDLPETLYTARKQPVHRWLSPATIVSSPNEEPYGSEVWLGSSNYMANYDDGSNRYLHYVLRCMLQFATDFESENPNEYVTNFGCPTIGCTSEVINLVISKLNSITGVFDGKTVYDFIDGIYWLPIRPRFANATILGMYKTLSFVLDPIRFPPNSAKPISQLYQDVVWKFIVRDPYFGNEAWKNYAPHKRYYLQFQPFGRIELEPTHFYWHESDATECVFFLKATVNIITGETTLYYGPDYYADYYIGSGNCRIDCSIVSENSNKLMQGYGGLASAISGAVASNPLAIAAGIQAIGSSMTTDLGVRSGAQGFIDEAPTVYYVEDVNTDPSPESFGKPYFKDALLSSLTGFTQIGNVHITGDHFSTATTDELDKIESQLKSGVIL